VILVLKEGYEMRTLSSTLLAAQKTDSHVPYLKVIVRNKLSGIVRLKWDRLYTGTEPDYYHSLTMPDDGSLVRARVGPADDNNKLYRQRVIDPGPQSNFSTWTYTGQYNCQAVTVASHNAEVCIFWVNLNRELKCLLSADYGATWGNAVTLDYSPYDLFEGISAAYKSNGDIAIFFANENTLYVKKRVNGSWLGKLAWDKNTGYLTSVAVVYDGDWNLIVTGQDSNGNYRAWSFVYGDGDEVPVGEWSELQEFASAPAGGNYEFHSVCMDKPDVFRVFYVEKFSGLQPYNRPYQSMSVPETEFLSVLWREPVPFNLSSEFGIAITHYGDYCWISTPSGVWIANLLEQNIDLTADILSVQLELSRIDGKLMLELSNEDGKYNSPSTGNLAVLDTGCQLDVSPGYVTSQGNEVSDGISFWLEAYEHTSSPGKATLILHAIDGWRLLDAWRARYQFRWNKDGAETSIKKIMEYILARVGLKLEVKSQSSIVTGFCPDFTIHPGDTGTAVMTRLLSFVPDFLFIEGVKAYLVYPQESDSSVYSYGVLHGIFGGRYQTGANRANQIRIEGYDPETSTPFAVDSLDWQQIEKFPERFQLVFDKNIETVSQAEARGAVLLRKSVMMAINGIISSPVNCGLQMYDVVTITDNYAGLSAVKRRVMGLVLDYRRNKGKYTHQLVLGGV
jgi:hypothetical protein